MIHRVVLKTKCKCSRLLRKEYDRPPGDVVGRTIEIDITTPPVRLGHTIAERRAFRSTNVYFEAPNGELLWEYEEV